MDANTEGSGKLTVLHHASRIGHVDIIKYLTEDCHCNPRLTNEMNNMPLHIAAGSNHWDIVKYYISELNVDANTEGSRKQTVLHHASKIGHLGIIKYLTKECHCNPKLRNAMNDMPLHIAAENNHWDIVKYYIIEMNVDASTNGSIFCETLLHCASEKGNIEMVKYLIVDCNCNPNCRDRSNKLPLHLAAKKGHWSLVKYFFGFNIDDEGIQNMTALHFASKQGHLEIIKYLIEHCHCNPGLRNHKNELPMHTAAQNGHWDIVKYFVDKININASSEGFRNWSLLHYASGKGCLDIIKYLIEDCGCNPNLKNEENDMPLHVAAKNYHWVIVIYFKELGMNLNYEGSKNWTPLHHASQKSNFETVKYLIEDCKCNPSLRNENNDMPLHIAAKNGHWNVVTYYIGECNIDVNEKGFKLWTVLHHASEKGYLDIVECLIEDCHCNPKLRNENNDMPLHVAAKNGHWNIVSYYIGECNIDVNEEGLKKWTVLHHASEKGHLDIVKCLIEDCHCNPMLINENNDMPLHTAAKKGHWNIATYFIDACNIDANSKGHKNWSLLHHAATERGNLDIMKYLVEECHCNPNLRSDNNEIPLHIAVLNSKLNVVKYFIEEQNIDASSKVFKGFTPLHYASEKGYLDLVKYLIENCNCNPEIRNDDNFMPLHTAAASGKLNVVKYFIEEQNIDENAKGSKGWTPLHNASKDGHLDIIKYLIENCHCNPEIKHDSNSMPLHTAAANGKLNIVKYFIEEQNIDKNAKGFAGFTPLHYASQNGYLDVVKYLIENCHCNSEIRNDDNSMPLHIAAENGRLNIVKYSIEEQNMDASSKGFKGWTPLHYASENGHYDTVVYLTENCKCSSTTINVQGSTPLHIAAQNGHLKLVEYFVTKKKNDIHASNKFKETPLHMATIQGHLNVVKYIIQSLKLLDYCITRSGGFSNNHKCTNIYLTSKNSVLFCAAKNGHTDILQFICSYCRIDPVLQNNIKDVKQISNKAVTHYIENYVDPLHEAAKNGELDKLKDYIERKKWSPLLKDRHNNNALHTAAQYGHLESVKYLLTLHDFRLGLLCLNKQGESPEHLAVKNGFFNVASYIILTSGKVTNAKHLQFTHSVLIIGNRLSGKSTLAKSMISKKSLVERYFQVRGVAPATAGIVPHFVEDELMGNIKIYDFAGHEEYYASHESILQQFVHPVVLIVVDISMSITKIKNQLSYWATILQNSSKPSMISLLVIASHVDICLDSSSKLAEASGFMREMINSGSLTVNYNGIFECDCRYSGSSHMKILCTKIVDVCKHIHLSNLKEYSKDENRLCTCFKNYIEEKRTILPPTLKIKDILEKLVQDKESITYVSDLCDINNLIKVCEILHYKGYLLYFADDISPSNNLLILKEDEIIENLHSSLNIIRSTITNKLGMIEETELIKLFSQTEGMLMDPTDCIKYLIFAQFCTLVSSESLVSLNELSSLKNNYYFFPNLVNENRPSYARQKYTDSYTWTLCCTEPNQFFTPRCIHVLLIILSEYGSSGENIKIDIWKNGIALINGSFVYSEIEFTDQTRKIMLIMKCSENYELALVKWRSELIATIKTIMKKLCPNFVLRESLICPQQYLLHQNTEIPMCDIISAIRKGDPGVTCKDEENKMATIPLEKLLFFDFFNALRSCNCFEVVVKSQYSDQRVPINILEHIRAKLDNDYIQKFLNGFIEDNKKLKFSELVCELLQYSVITEDNVQDLIQSQSSEKDCEPNYIVKVDNLENKTKHRESQFVFNMRNLRLLESPRQNCKLQLINQISPQWKEAADLLGLSLDLVQRIEKNNHYKVEECCRQVFEEWLCEEDGMYQYSTDWKGFCRLLQDMNLSTLSEQVASVVLHRT